MVNCCIGDCQSLGAKKYHGKLQCPKIEDHQIWECGSPKRHKFCATCQKAAKSTTDSGQTNLRGAPRLFEVFFNEDFDQ